MQPMETKQNKHTWLDILQLMSLLWVMRWPERKTELFLRAYATELYERSFIWQFILFSEHLLQLEEQKYGWGALPQARAVLDPGLKTRPRSGRKHVNPFRP